MFNKQNKQLIEENLRLQKENKRLNTMLNMAIMDRCLWTADGDIQNEVITYKGELEKRFALIEERKIVDGVEK